MHRARSGSICGLSDALAQKKLLSQSCGGEEAIQRNGVAVLPMAARDNDIGGVSHHPIGGVARGGVGGD